jgi:hypothetical protein
MNTVNDGGAMAIRFNESTPGLRGSKVAGSPAPDSYITSCRKNAVDNLNTIAANSGRSTGEVVRMVLNQSRPELEQFIIMHGETPASTLDGVITQAALLRADDIATVAQSTGMSDADALAVIESGESDAILNGTSDADEVLSPDTMAALNYAIAYFQNAMAGTTGAQNLSQAMQAAKGTVATPSNSSSSFDGFMFGSLVARHGNSFDGSDAEAAEYQNTDPSANLAPAQLDTSQGGTGTTISPVVAPAQLNVSAAVANSSGNIQTTAPTLTLTPGAAAAASSAQNTATANAVAPTFMQIMNGIAATASTLNSSIRGVASTVSSTANNLGAGAISTWISQNKTFLIIAAVVIILVIIIAARAARR